jgi:alkyldihydroxyacetonephosphate synthase
MALSREEIVDALVGLLGPGQVDTDEAELRASSADRFRQFETIFGVYTLPIPAAVAYVGSTEQVAKVLAFANQHGINVVPRTGRSATEGGLETAVENSVVLDGSRMNRVVAVDPVDMLATVQCGVGLQVLDDLLAGQGFTTGHSPQSKPLAQLGGLVATRSIGQLSTLYGGIEDMVVGLEAVLPDGGVVRIKNVPRRATGPDIRHVVIGNEGALCFITEVTVKIFKLPAQRVFLGYALDSMKEGFEVLREVMVEGYRPSVARLYDVPDGGHHFSAIAKDRCVLIFAAEGNTRIAEATAAGIDELVRAHPGIDRLDPAPIETWFANLNWGPEQIAAEREGILSTRTIGFTTEVSGTWSVIHEIYQAVMMRLPAEIPDLLLVGGHSSHSYLNGTNMYFVYSYVVRDCPPEQEITKYHRPIMTLICEETLRHGGSIVHHHGMGKARATLAPQEYGSSYRILETLKRAFDPNGIMNAGTVIPR